MKIERDLAGRDADGIPGAIRIGGMIFVDACEGGRGDVAQQCEAAYATMADRLRRCGVGAENVVRLDHYTESQSWLAERQAIRAKYFGRPAPVASTGVAVRHLRPNRLSVAGVAVQDAAKKELRVAGEPFGMAAIATAVDAGDLVFISGILNDGGHRARVGDDGEFERQARGCFHTIRSILDQLRLSPTDVVRQDIYIDESCHYADLLNPPESKGFLVANVARAGAKLPFGGGDLIEVTTIASRRGIDIAETLADANLGATVRAGGLGFTDASGDSVGAALENLVRRLERVGLAREAIVRLDIRCPEPEDCACARSVVSRSLTGAEPVITAYAGLSLAGGPIGVSAIVAAG